MIVRSSIALLALTLIVIAGCSGDNQPVTLSDTTVTYSNGLPVGVTDWLKDGSPSQGIGALGLYSLSIDPASTSVELASLRQGALTEVLEVVDITNFLQISPCADCVIINSISIDMDDNLVVNIGVKHPFDAGDPLKPVSGQNRGDLHVFNVEGIIFSNTSGTAFPGIGHTTAGFTLENADGYSGYLDEVLDEIYPSDATVHPYILHFDDYSAGNFDAANPMGFGSVTDPPPSGNLVMAMGSDYDYQDYVFDLDSGPMDFILAIGCTYAVSAAAKIDRFSPEYRIPQHNKKAASEVSFEIVSNDLKGEDTLSSAEVEVHVVDKSHGVEVGGNLDEMYAESSVDDIFIEVPGVTLLPVVIDGNNPASGTGHDPSDPLIYEATITNDAGGTEGTYPGLIKVSDNYAPGQNQSAILNSMDGIKRVGPFDNPIVGLFAISEFATYQTFSIYVELGNELPVAVLVTNPDPADIIQYQTVDFAGTGSYDTDGTILQYEFDFDWDGNEANFTADTSNATGLCTSDPYDNYGSFTAGLRVTDDLAGVDYDSVTVTVTELTIIYVDDSNTSGTEDGTQAYPYNTIQGGLAAAVSGDEVWVDDSGNDYTGPITLAAGVVLKSDNWDTSDGSDQAVINAASTQVVTGADGATIDGFKVTGGTRYGIRINGVDTNVLNCWIDTIIGNPVFGIYVEDSTSSLIQGCEISEIHSTQTTQYVIGIYTNDCTSSGVDHVIIKQNYIHNIFTDGVEGGRMTNVYGMYIFDSSGIELNNNIVNDVLGGNWNSSHGVLIGACNNINFVNNVIYNVRKSHHIGTAYGVYIWSTPGFNGRNNIVNRILAYGFLQSSYCVYAPEGTVWEYCDVYLAGNDLYSGGITPGEGCISEDPFFVNAGTDFHLADASPCIDTGDPDSVYDDPDGTRNDMGCYGGPGGYWLVK